MAEIDLMIKRVDLEDNTRKGLQALVDKLVALGYNDFHEGGIFEVGRVLPVLKYVSVEVKGYDTRDVCLANRPNSDDIVALTEEEFLSLAAQYAPTK